jgi:hypothetical protein
VNIALFKSEKQRSRIAASEGLSLPVAFFMSDTALDYGMQLGFPRSSCEVRGERMLQILGIYPKAPKKRNSHELGRPSKQRSGSDTVAGHASKLLDQP